MKKLYPLLPVLLLIYWGCEEFLSINDEDSGPSVNLWGVDYSVENTTELGIYLNELTGPIPPEIGNLINLEKLYIENNQLTGPIPPEIGNLINLRTLYLNDNQLTGPIPSEIGNLINLRNLYLNSNQLIGRIPPEIGNLTNLERLYLNDNHFIGQIPLELEDLSSLRSLNLSQNQLTGVNPEIICNVYELMKDYGTFNIGNNLFCPPYPSCVEDYMGLQNVCFCGLDDNEVVYLWGKCYFIETTTELNLSDNGLIGEIPSEIGDLINLEKLYLNNNQLTGSIPPSIGNLTNLIELRIQDNQLTGSIPPSIGNLTNLIELRIQNNQLTGEIPEIICDLSNLYRPIYAFGTFTGYYSRGFSCFENQLCPPYPFCNVVSNGYSVGEQDTSDCD